MSTGRNAYTRTCLIKPIILDSVSGDIFVDLTVLEIGCRLSLNPTLSLMIESIATRLLMPYLDGELHIDYCMKLKYFCTHRSAINTSGTLLVHITLQIIFNNKTIITLPNTSYLEHANCID